MAIKKDKVDAVLVGFGWTGAILGQELTEAGLHVLALERGAMQDTPKDAEYPKVADELAYSVRGKLFQDLSKETVTIRHGVDDVAVPYRQNGSFLLGTGVGGAASTGTACTTACCPKSWSCAPATKRAMARASFLKA